MVRPKSKPILINCMKIYNKPSATWKIKFLMNFFKYWNEFKIITKFEFLIVNKRFSKSIFTYNVSLVSSVQETMKMWKKIERYKISE